MRILLVNAVCGVTSTGRICTDLAGSLEGLGHEVRIAYGREDRGMTELGSLYGKPIGRELDVKLHGLRTRLFDGHGFGSQRATEEFLRWVDEYQPDILHLHNLHGYYLNIELLFQYIKQRNQNVVWTLHDCWAMTGHCSYFTACGCEKWKKQCMHCPQKQNYPSSWWLDASKRNYSRKKKAFTGVEHLTITTPSMWLKSVAEQSFLREYQVRVVRNGIDTAVFQPTESDLRERYGLLGQRIVLGAANHWGERKGLSYLLRLANDLPEGWKVVLVGLSKKQQAQLPGNILGIQKTNSPQELAAWYTAADVFVSPSLEDNYPTAVLEAQACGTPVVVFASGGAPETVMPGKGYVVKGLDYGGLLEKTMGGAALKKDFGWVEIKDKRTLGSEYEAIYQELLDGRSKAR